MDYNDSRAALIVYEKKEDAQYIMDIIKDKERYIYNTQYQKIQTHFVFDNRKLP